jgi:hypothetical protein
MNTEQTKAYLTEVKDEAENYLGRQITTPQWEKALMQATRKLAFIIEREGDSNGERTKPYYLGKLVEEAISAEEFSRYTQEKSRRLSATTQIILPELYTAHGSKVNAAAE